MNQNQQKATHLIWYVSSNNWTEDCYKTRVNRFFYLELSRGWNFIRCSLYEKSIPAEMSLSKQPLKVQEPCFVFLSGYQGWGLVIHNLHSSPIQAAPVTGFGLNSVISGGTWDLTWTHLSQSHSWVPMSSPSLPAQPSPLPLANLQPASSCKLPWRC